MVPQHMFPGHGQMKPEQLEIAQLKREVTKLKAERDILNLFDDRSRRRLLDEPLSQRAGQCGDRELLPVADHRAYSAKNVSECDEAEADVFDYIEYFYNPRRRPSTIG